MDTKLKKFKIWERTAFRVIIFLLCGIFAVGAVCLALLGENRLSEFQRKNNYYFNAVDAFSSGSFFGSETFSNSISSDVTMLMYLYDGFAGRDGLHVTQGEIYERDVEDTLRALYAQMEDYFRGQYEYNEPYGHPDGNYGYDDGRVFVWWSPGYYENIEFDMTKLFDSPVVDPYGNFRAFSEEGVREAFFDLFPEQVRQIRQIIAKDRQERFDYAVKELAGMLYFVSDGERVLTNVALNNEGKPTKNLLSEGPVWVVIEKGWLTDSSDESIMIRNSFERELSGASAYVVWTGEAMASREWLYSEARGIVHVYFFTAIALAALAVVFLVMSIVFTGRKRAAFEDTRKLWACDRIFVEFQIALIIVATLIGGFLTVQLLSSFRFYENFEIFIGLAFGAGLIFALVFLWFLLSLVRVGKAGLFAERSLIVKFARGPARALGNTIKSGYDGRNPLAKTLIIVILFWFVTALFSGICGVSLMRGGQGGAVLVFGVLLLLTLAGAIYFTRKWAERYGRLRKGVEEIGNGNLDYKIEIKGDGKNEFDRLSALINELGSAQNAAIQNELKNQRLKTDLISNVSHDLKTPLTSIITYTDLLKTEGLESKNAREYLRIIDEKGRRLQKLTEDLFDAAKASSGAIPVRKEKVDLLALIRQEIAEMNGSFDEAGLELVIEAESENYYVEADSQLLWRVVDNLLRNALKYSQAGTRVYIELKEDKKTTLEIKNTSTVKLNIPPAELMERFKRGDESRASEGSGLGLAIAKDLVHLQDGRLELVIDGDLFKVIVTLPTY